MLADGGRIAAAMGSEDQGGLGELGAGLQQAVELSALLQLVEPPDGGDDPLSAAAVLPAVLDDLQIDVRAGSFLAEEHGGLRAGLGDATMNLTHIPAKCQ